MFSPETRKGKETNLLQTATSRPNFHYCIKQVFTYLLEVDFSNISNSLFCFSWSLIDMTKETI